MSVAAGERRGHAGEQQIEEAVQLGGAIIGGQGGCQGAQLREFGDREPVKTKPEHMVGFLGSLDNLLQLIEDVAVQVTVPLSAREMSRWL